MGIIKIEKDLKANVTGSTTNVKKNVYDINDSLDSLNNLSAYEGNDINQDTNVGTKDTARIKNEINIVRACVRTSVKSFFSSIIDILILGGIIFSLLYFTGWINKVKSFFINIISRTGETFIFYLIGCLILLLCCLIVRGNIRGSIKGIFKYKYLNKMNIYIYDGFIVIWNIIFYIFIAVLFFLLVNNYQDIFKLLVKVNFMNTANISIEGYSYIKYIIVVVISLFLSLNSLRCVSLVHRLNKFVLEDEV